jgi:hypothetical protein
LSIEAQERAKATVFKQHSVRSGEAERRLIASELKIGEHEVEERPKTAPKHPKTATEASRFGYFSLASTLIIIILI